MSKADDIVQRGYEAHMRTIDARRRRRENATDISDQVRTICERLGLVYTDVLELRILPTECVATLAHNREDGSKHIDLATGGFVTVRVTKDIKG